MKRLLCVLAMSVFLASIDSCTNQAARTQPGPGVGGPGGGSPSVGDQYVQRELDAPGPAITELNTLRAKIRDEKRSYSVGFTSILQGLQNHPLTDFTGAKPPPNLADIVKQSARTHPIVASGVLPSKFDWLTDGKVTPVKSQGDCGSCWAFSALAPFESSGMRRINPVPQPPIDLSEQNVLDCSGAGECGGGWWGGVYDFLQSDTGGVATTSAYGRYTGVKGACRGVARPFHASVWAYVDPQNNPNLIPSTEAMKQAIKDKGPIVVAFTATRAFASYSSGVFSEMPNGDYKINHGICIIGWDDNRGAWHIKNSWDIIWGERGLGWVAYENNNIGLGAAWVEMKTP